MIVVVGGFFGDEESYRDPWINPLECETQRPVSPVEVGVMVGGATAALTVEIPSQELQ